MGMQFKEAFLEDEYKKSPILLQIICNDFADYCLDHFNVVVMCTRVREPVSGSSGVHEALRAVDFRNEYPVGNFRFSSEEQVEISRFINEKYYRNDNHPTLIFHSFCDGPNHVHIQIAAETTVYMKES